MDNSINSINKVTIKRIKENFAKKGIANFIDFCETVRGKSNSDLKDYAARLAESKPMAAILALKVVNLKSKSPKV